MSEPMLRSFRITGDPSLHPQVASLLMEEGFRFEAEPFSPSCFRLLHEPFPLGSSLAALFGLIYIQDRSSMLPPLVLAPGPSECVLDMCASPGSKTSFLAAWTRALVLANEPNPSRLATLRANLSRLDLAQVVSCSYDAQKLPLPKNSFDCILLDPPCSGWGTAAKNPQVLRIWKGEKLSPLIALQKSLLKKAYALLKPGGRLIYSTCTTNPAENEAQVRMACEELGLVPGTIAQPKGFVLDETVSCALRINEKASHAQGFFVALLKKEGKIASDTQASSHLPGQFFDLARHCPAARLPAGSARLFGDKVFFLPEDAGRLLPGNFRFRGYLLGTIHGDSFLMEPYTRQLAAPTPTGDSSFVFEEIKAVRNFLSGQSCSTNLTCKNALLFFRDLPLAWVRVKKGRLLATIH